VKPLFGRRVVVTCPREQARELAELLEDQGAQVILAPTVRLAPVDDDTELDAACADISRFDWVVLPRLSGAEVFLRRMFACGIDVRNLNGVGLCAIGQSAVERFAGVGLRVDVARAEFRPDAIIDALSAGKGLRGRRVLLLQAEGARDVLASELRKAGAEVVEIGAYRTVRIMPGDPESRTSTRCCWSSRWTSSRSPARRRWWSSWTSTARTRWPTCCARRWCVRGAGYRPGRDCARRDAGRRARGVHGAGDGGRHRALPAERRGLCLQLRPRRCRAPSGTRAAS